MPIVLGKLAVDGLSAALRAVREWQSDGSPMQLHPGISVGTGDSGPTRWVAAVRAWRRDGEIVALGPLDAPGLVRVAIHPSAQNDEALARRLLTDTNRPTRGILPAGNAAVEARSATRLRALLLAEGWADGES